LQYDFASTAANSKGIADAFMSYNGFDDLLTATNGAVHDQDEVGA
jgi:hypothetical protein